MTRPLAMGRLALLARPRREDEADFLRLVAANRELHEPWVYPPSTPEAFRAYLRVMRRPDHSAFFLRDRETGRLAGVANLSHVVWGALQSAYVGYYAFAPLAGRGYMTEGIGLVVEYAFAAMGLHRVEANIQPGNTRSVALVKRLGFRYEGFSPRYLMIGGEWRDHERWAVTAEEWRTP